MNICQVLCAYCACHCDSVFGLSRRQ